MRMRDLVPPTSGSVPSVSSSSSQPAARPAPPPGTRPKFSHRAIRALRGCATTCPFTKGVACEPGGAVIGVPLKDSREGLVPEGVTRICAGCAPKLDAARAELKASLEEERRARAQVKKAAKIAKRRARDEADAAVRELREAVRQVAQARECARELEATAKERRKARARERREALLRLRACEGAVRAANRALAEAQRAVSNLPPVESPKEDSVDQEALMALLAPVAERAVTALGATSKSYQRKSTDKALWAEVFELIEWLEPGGESA